MVFFRVGITKFRNLCNKCRNFPLRGCRSLDGEPPVVGNLPQADAQDVLQGVQQAVAVVDPAGGATAHLRGVLDPGLVVQGGVKCIFAL